MTSANTMSAACKPFSREEQWLTGQLKNITLSIHKQHVEETFHKKYEHRFCEELEKRSIPFEGETDVQIIGNDTIVGEGMRVDITADAAAIIWQGRHSFQPAWETQLRNYLKMSGRRIGYILHFPLAMGKTDVTQRVYYSGKNNLMLITFSM